GVVGWGGGGGFGGGGWWGGGGGVDVEGGFGCIFLRYRQERLGEMKPNFCEISLIDNNGSSSIFFPRSMINPSIISLGVQLRTFFVTDDNVLTVMLRDSA